MKVERKANGGCGAMFRAQSRDPFECKGMPSIESCSSVVDRGHSANFVKVDGEKHLLPLLDLRTACTAISPDDQMVQLGDSATSRVLPWISAQPMLCVSDCSVIN